jgi:glutamate 5-kinase
LAAGVVNIEGEFVKGDVVAICGPDGAEFARGLTNYDSDEISRIRGQKTQKIAGILGYRPYDEIVHRDNMIVTKIAKTK